LSLYSTNSQFLQALDYGEQPETESRQFAKVALPETIPVLLQIFTKQDEDADADERNLSKAAATCINLIELLIVVVQDVIVPAVILFIEAHIKWHFHETAVMTFGFILDGLEPSILTPLVNQALPRHCLCYGSHCSVTMQAFGLTLSFYTKYLRSRLIRCVQV
jgi:hypothetical protein